MRLSDDSGHRVLLYSAEPGTASAAALNLLASTVAADSARSGAGERQSI
jgi:hypothetical protein